MRRFFPSLHILVLPWMAFIAIQAQTSQETRIKGVEEQVTKDTQAIAETALKTLRSLASNNRYRTLGFSSPDEAGKARLMPPLDNVSQAFHHYIGERSKNRIASANTVARSVGTVFGIVKSVFVAFAEPYKYLRQISSRCNVDDWKTSAGRSCHRHTARRNQDIVTLQAKRPC